MEELATQLAKADRLVAITQRVGFALWQIQELEGVAAQYFVLVAQAQKGMGFAAGDALEEKAKKKTFGATIRRMAKAGLLSADLEERFERLLTERNWLVHRSRADSRSAVYHDRDANRLVERLDAMADEALALLKVIGELTEAHVRRHGVSDKYISEHAERLLRQWHAADEI